jgi:hypothetical protein
MKFGRHIFEDRIWWQFVYRSLLCTLSLLFTKQLDEGFTKLGLQSKNMIGGAGSASTQSQVIVHSYHQASDICLP